MVTRFRLSRSKILLKFVRRFSTNNQGNILLRASHVNKPKAGRVIHCILAKEMLYESMTGYGVIDPKVAS